MNESDATDTPANIAVLRGAVRGEPVTRVLPSGGVVVQFDVSTTVRSRGDGVEHVGSGRLGRSVERFDGMSRRGQRAGRRRHGAATLLPGRRRHSEPHRGGRRVGHPGPTAQAGRRRARRGRSIDCAPRDGAVSHETADDEARSQLRREERRLGWHQRAFAGGSLDLGDAHRSDQHRSDGGTRGDCIDDVVDAVLIRDAMVEVGQCMLQPGAVERPHRVEGPGSR